MDEKPLDLSKHSTSLTIEHHCISSEKVNFGNEMDDEPLDLRKNSISSTKIYQIKTSEKHLVADRLHESKTQTDSECKNRAIAGCSCSGPSTSANCCPDFVTIIEPSTDLNRESNLISGHCGIGCATYMDKTFRREICGERISEDHEPTMHMRQHNGDQPFQECKRAFVSSSDLNTHKERKNRKGKKSFSCQICDKGFSSKADMERHNRTHTGEKPHACPICGKAFSQKTNMKTHVRTHTREKPHTCPICGKGFAQKGNMEMHITTHTRVKPHACPICGKSFSNKASMESHKKAKHNLSAQ